MRDAREPEQLRQKLVELLEDFESKLREEDLREQVRALVPARGLVQDLGSALIDENAARDRILEYFRRYPKTIIDGEELAVVAGISEWARRIRELRVEHGWFIVSGKTANEMADEGQFPLQDFDVSEMEPDDYILLEEEQDREAAHRWHIANDIRGRTDLSMKNRLLLYLRENVGEKVTGEELKYVASGGSTWARRIRELRTEEGWPISTCYSGRPDLNPGIYVLEKDRQLPEHDRDVGERLRRRVLRRDDHECQDCGWTHEDWNRSDPRHLEVHHLHPHAEGGGNEPENLLTLCNICHDERHATDSHSEDG